MVPKLGVPDLASLVINRRGEKCHKVILSVIVINIQSDFHMVDEKSSEHLKSSQIAKCFIV